MENPIIVPFDLNTARKIKSGEIEGSVLINNIEIEFVYESKDCAGPYNLLFVRKDEYGISAIYANTEGCALGDTTLELRVEAGAYFKEGDILTSTKGCQFIYDGLITEGAMGSICGMTTYGDIEIVYEDNLCNEYPLLVVIHSIPVLADWFSSTGKAFNDANRLLLEVPEYATFKDGDVLSDEEGNYIFILNTNGKYLTSLYASLAAGTSLNISDNIAASENNIERYRLATDSEKQRMINALKASNNPKAKEYLKRFFGIEEKPKYDFKPFDKVLVKYYEDDNWEGNLFIKTITDDQDGETKYECLNGVVFVHCIPFEGNECLLGITENPEKK